MQIGKPIHLLSMDSLHKRIEKRIPGSKPATQNYKKDSGKESSSDEKETPKNKLIVRFQ